VEHAVEELVAERRAVLAQPPTGREVRAYALGALVFFATAIPLALGGASGRAWDWDLAIVLVLAYAGATRVHFETGLGSTDGSLVVLLPMLFLLPAEAVPLAVLAGLLLGRLPDYVLGRVHPGKALFAPANSIHAVGAATVFALAIDGPGWSDWPWYLAAFAAYALSDAATALVTEWIAHGVVPLLQARVLGEIYLLDALLAPIGVMAAFATEAASYAFLLASPLLLLLRGEARERAARLDKALELSESRRELLEAELAAARSREEVLATVSHGLQMPLATIMGLSKLLVERGEDLPATRRAETFGALYDEAVALRQLVRQALDFVALRSGQPLRVAPEDMDVGTVAGDLGAEVPATPVVAHADPTRVRQVLMALQSHARRAGGGTLSVSAEGGVRAVLELPGELPADPEALFAMPESGGTEADGPGIDLVVARALCRAMDGDLHAESATSGWRLVAELPAGHAVTPAR
jgi:signal transduction histidine kinase